MVSLRFYRRLVAPVLFSAAVGCGGGDLVLPSDGTPVQINAFEGNEQVGNAGLPLPAPVVAQVVDQAGRPVAGIEIVFQLTDDEVGGDVSPDTVVSDSLGLAEATWTLGGRLGSQAVEARVPDESLTVRFTASAGASEARRIRAVGGDEQSAPAGSALPESLVVEVTDQFGNPVEG
nr:hypothetical protein [Gemmatimonadales bacterium]